MKKFISILLAVIIAFSVISTTVFAEKEAVLGDTNGDGGTSAVDARLILRHVAGLGEQPKDLTAYDVNGDGNVTGVDARIVLQIVAGIYLGTELDTKSEQLAYFVKSFNGVKENAASVTHVGVKSYNYNNHLYIDPAIKELYNMTIQPGDPTIEESVLTEFTNELVVMNNEYTGEDIASYFPPAGGTCNLTMDDISDISFKEDGDYYVVEVTVKGKKNPGKYESVGNVASIVTKEDLEADMDPEELQYTKITCDYKDAVAVAKIEKATGNMVEYNVDYPMIMTTAMFDLPIEVGMGFYEEWTVKY